MSCSIINPVSLFESCARRLYQSSGLDVKLDAIKTMPTHKKICYTALVTAAIATVVMCPQLRLAACAMLYLAGSLATITTQLLILAGYLTVTGIKNGSGLLEGATGLFSSLFKGKLEDLSNRGSGKGESAILLNPISQDDIASLTTKKEGEKQSSIMRTNFDKIWDKVVGEKQQPAVENTGISFEDYSSFEEFWEGVETNSENASTEEQNKNFSTAWDEVKEGKGSLSSAPSTSSDKIPANDKERQVPEAVLQKVWKERAKNVAFVKQKDANTPSQEKAMTPQAKLAKLKEEWLARQAYYKANNNFPAGMRPRL